MSVLPAEAKAGAVTFDFDTMKFRGPYILVTTADMPLKKPAAGAGKK